MGSAVPNRSIECIASAELMTPDISLHAVRRTPMGLVLIAAGGALGAVARFLVDSFVAETLGTTYPMGTLLVNVSGSFVLGLLFALAIERDVLPADIRGPVFVGFLGAYTTFSTLTLESWRLMESGAIGLGLGYLLGSCALGVLAVVGGLALGRAI
jgi:CrcB protein